MLGKRVRGDAPHWVITFADTSSLRCIVASVEAIRQKITFRVKKSESAYCMMIDTGDPGMTCCVSVRLQLDSITFKSSYSGEFEFCLDAKQLMYSMDSPSAMHASLIVEGYPDTATICIRARDPDQPSHEDSATLSTYVDDDETPGLDNLEFDMIMEIDVTKLRELVKKARKAHSEFLRVCIATKKFGPKERSLVTLSVHGETTHVSSFCNEMTKDVDGSMIVRAAMDCNTESCDMDDADVRFKGTFPVEKIEGFVKNLQVRMISAKVANNMPIMLMHKLGASDDEVSHIHFLVAPRFDD